MDSTDVRALPARIETLLDQLAGEPAAAQCAEELVGSVVQLSGAGLSRMVELLADTPEGQQMLHRLAADELVAGLLLLHGLHPDDTDTRIHTALEKVRPYLGSHAGGIDYLGIDEEGTAHLRLKGSCDGCAGSAATVHDAVERAVLSAAPEVRQVQVDGMVEPTTRPQLLQIGMRCPDGLAEAVGR